MQKKSLISTLKTTKKANVATAPAKNEGSTTKKTIRRPSAAIRGRS
jgi:hypothetical protein